MNKKSALGVLALAVLVPVTNGLVHLALGSPKGAVQEAKRGDRPAEGFVHADTLGDGHIRVMAMLNVGLARQHVDAVPVVRIYRKSVMPDHLVVEQRFGEDTIASLPGQKTNPFFERVLVSNDLGPGRYVVQFSLVTPGAARGGEEDDFGGGDLRFWSRSVVVDIR